MKIRFALAAVMIFIFSTNQSGRSQEIAQWGWLFGDECSSYSSFTCKQIETADYNVVFSFPKGTETYQLGQAKGLSQCGQIAHSYAASKNLSRNDGWSYACCMIAKGSSCYEKHR
jgi:hypothetical protein